MRPEELVAVEVALQQVHVLLPPVLANDKKDAVTRELELNLQIEEGRAVVELGRLELEAEDADEELPQVGGGGGVIGQQGGDEVIDVVAGGEAEDLGDDRRDGACWQAIAGTASVSLNSNLHGSK